MIFKLDLQAVKPVPAWFTATQALALALLLALAFALAGCSDGEALLSPTERARSALAIGDAVQAEVILRDQLATGVSKNELAALLGEAELQQGQIAEARTWLGNGEFSDDTRAHGFHMLGRLEMEEGNLPAAGAAFDKALAENRKNAGLWVDIARLRYRGGEQIMAVDASIHAVGLDPNNPRALQFRAQLVRDSEGMAAALPWFERALEKNPDNTDLLYDYAATLGELGRVRDMLVVIRRIAEINPAERRIYFLQSVIAARAEKFALARSLLLRSDKAAQALPAAMLLSGIIDMENRNYASAAQTLERLAATQPDNRRIRQMLARALSLSGSDKELVYRFAEIAARPEASPYLITLVGRSYEALDEREKAAHYLDLAAKPRSARLVAIHTNRQMGNGAVDIAPSGRDALDMVRAGISSQNTDLPLRFAERFLERFPGSADALSLAGDAALAAGQNRTAINRYKAASTIRQPWAITKKLYAALIASDRESSALAVLARYFIGDPGNIEAAGMLARIAIGNEDWQGAAVFLDHAIRNGGYRDPILLSLSAEVALQRGDIELALHDAEGAYTIQPLSREATRALAMAYRATGENEGWALELEEKLKQMPQG